MNQTSDFRKEIPKSAGKDTASQLHSRDEMAEWQRLESQSCVNQGEGGRNEQIGPQVSAACHGGAGSQRSNKCTQLSSEPSGVTALRSPGLERHRRETFALHCSVVFGF